MINDEIKAIIEQKIPRPLVQFIDLNGDLPEFYWNCAAKMKGMTLEEYSKFYKNKSKK